MNRYFIIGKTRKDNTLKIFEANVEFKFYADMMNYIETHKNELEAEFWTYDTYVWEATLSQCSGECFLGEWLRFLKENK